MKVLLYAADYVSVSQPVIRVPVHVKQYVVHWYH